MKKNNIFKVSWKVTLAIFGVVLLLVVLVLFSKNFIRFGSPNKSTAAPTWDLVWGDEFDDASVNTAKWGVQDPAPGSAYNMGGYLNYGDAAYNPRNVTESNGLLHLTTDRTPYNGKSYSTGGVSTYKKYTFQYGKVDIRAQLPKMTNSLWPALWFVAEDSGRNCVYEVDLMEAVDNPRTIYFNYHDNAHSNGSVSSTVSGTDLSAAMHDYEIEWNPTTIVYRFDGVERLRTPYSPNLPMYLMMNTALHGSWAAPVDSTTVLPTTFNIDYVRVYKEGTGTADTTAPTVSISSPANNASVTGVVPITANASDNVAVSKVDFYVDGTLKSSDTSAPYSYSWDTANVADGSHILKAISVDSSNNSSIAAQIAVNKYTVTTPPPIPPPPPPVIVPLTLQITSPYTGSIVYGNRVGIFVTTSGSNPVKLVEYYIDGVKKYSQTYGPYYYYWPINGRRVTRGTHTIKVVATDSSGATATQTITVTK